MTKQVMTPKGKRSPRWAFMQRLTIVCENGENYLTRLRIVQTPWFGIYLHRIDQADTDLDPHDHPWSFYSFIVRGGYTEKIWPFPWQRETCGAEAVTYDRRWNRFSWHKMDRIKAHKIIDIAPNTISLLLVGPRTSDWGFWTAEGFVGWKEYEAKGLGNPA